MGRNCRFLQGPGTDPEHVAQLRVALTASPPRPATVTLLNYTKQGRPFWNALHVAPVSDADGRLEYLIGVQLDVTEAGEAADGGTANGVAAGECAWGCFERALAGSRACGLVTYVGQCRVHC